MSTDMNGADEHTRQQHAEQVEDTFLARFWNYASDPERLDECRKAAEVMEPTDFRGEARGEFWNVLSRRFVRNQQMHREDRATWQELLAVGPGEAVAALIDCAEVESRYPGQPLNRYAQPIKRAAKARALVVNLNATAREASAKLEAGEDPRELLEWGRERAADLVLFHEHGVRSDSARLSRPKDIAVAIRTGMDRRGMPGVRWPYPRLQRVVGGPLLPGQVVGITGEAGSGKSTLLACLLERFLDGGLPCLPAITEDADGWIRRAQAAAADIPQLVAEGELWDPSDLDVVRTLADEWKVGADEVQQLLTNCRNAYLPVVERFEGYPYTLIDRPNLSVDDLLAAWATLRRQWPGRHVVGMLDHAHNLYSPDGKVDLHMDGWIRRIKQFCKEDDDGGFSAIVLFQTRKAERGDRLAGFRAIPHREIAGRVGQHLNVHLSVYRQWVETDRDRFTPWGTPAARMFRGLPVFAPNQAKPDPEQHHEDTERVYLMCDKRRIEGAGPKNTLLNRKHMSGRVFEAARHLEAVA